MWVLLRRYFSAGGETRIVVDGVAYAPHLPMDVKGWGVDWYGFSVYKTWGPHMAALYGSHAAFQDLKVNPPPPPPPTHVSSSSPSFLLLFFVAPFLVSYLLFSFL